MAPNIKDGVSFNSCAVTYVSDSYSQSVVENNKINNIISEFVSLSSARIPTESEDNNRLRVKGRVKLPYALYRFSKNALLLFEYDDDGDGDGDGGGGGVDSTTQNIRRTFEKLRFEVDVQRNKSSDDVRSICHEFFQRDYSEYGAAAVMMLAPMSSVGTFQIAGSCPFTNSDLQKYFCDEQHIPASLKKKPKILITQSNNVQSYFANSAVNMASETHAFILTLPTVIFNNADEAGVNRMCRPINFLCEKLERMSEEKDFVQIVRDTITEARDTWPSVYRNKSHVFPFETTCTLNKHLYLWKSR